MSRIALILGAGPGVGHSVTAKLSEEGYKVAAASRNPDLSTATEKFLPVKLDLSNPEDIPKVFDEIKEKLGGFPNVVVYNAYASTFSPDHENILSGVSAAQISSEFTINTVSYWAAAQAAVAGWEKLDPTLPKAFIYTGNVLPWLNIPFCVSLGIGKASSALIAESLASTYGKRGFRFYFAYQVSDVDGGLYRGIDGPVTADTYLNLIKRSEQGTWRIAFDKNGKEWDVAA